MTAARSCVIPATSAADDLAFESLRDAVRATADMDEARIVGGHMSGLLLAAFPSADLEPRRTNDADAGISVEVAGGFRVHERLAAADYVEDGGNRLVRGDRAIDLLVPSDSGQFRPKLIAERAYDSAPGLRLALSSPPLTIDLTVVYRDDTDDRFDVRVPPVEIAVVLKAYAAGTRDEARDVTDLHHLLSIRHAHDPADIGGWQLDADPLSGSRGDAAAHLHRLADRAHRDPRMAEAEVPPGRFAALVREYVHRP